MKNYIKFNTPINLIKKGFNKSNSLNNFFPKTTSNKIYKIRERYFSPNSLSIITTPKNKFNPNFNNFKTNYTSLLESLKANDVDLKEKKLDIKSLDNLLININKLKILSRQKNFFEQKKDNKMLIQTYENKIPNIIKYKKNPPNIFLDKRKFFSEKNDKNKNNNIFTEKYGQILENNPLFEEKKYLLPDLKLVNQILKLNRSSAKIENIKDISPMKLDKNYEQFINNKIKLNYNPNFNSPKIHRISVTFMVDNITKNILKRDKAIQIRKKIEAKKKNERYKKLIKELIEEMRDNIEEISVETIKIKKKVKEFLKDETNLNQITNIKEEFYNNFENRINFLFDCRRFPVIKNNLNRIKIKIRAAKDFEWDKLNILGNCTLNYLNKLRVKLQRELDEIMESGNQEIENQLILYQDITKINELKKKNEKSKKKVIVEDVTQEENETSIDYIINIMKKEIKLKKEENKENKEKEKSEREDNYNYEEFFINKSRPYKLIDFASEKLSYIIFHNKEYFDPFSKIFFQKNNFKRKNLPNIYI